MAAKAHVRRWRALTVASASLATLAGCAIVDQYGPRAVTYNEEASSSKSSGILLNIMRAAYREPLQFTDMSTVTGTATASATVTGTTIPIRVGGPNFTAPDIMNITPAATMSGGPQFNIANLNTQEFYQGIQAPLETQLMANYVASGTPLTVLLPLFVSDIEVDYDKKLYTFHNGALSDQTYREFRDATLILVQKGLVLEPEPSNEAFGPVLDRDKASDPRLLAGLAQATSGATPAKLNLQGVKEKGGTVSTSQFQLSKPSTKWRFCFLPAQPTAPLDNVGVTISSSNSSVKPRRIPLLFYRSIPFELILDKTFICGQSKSRAPANGAKVQAAANLKFTMRSVEGIILFLGEVTRRELGLDSNPPGDLSYPAGGAESQDEINNLKFVPKYLFKVERGSPSTGGIGAELAGQTYSITSDPTGADASSQIIQILTDLMALKSSAKSLPAPSVITVAQ